MDSPYPLSGNLHEKPQLTTGPRLLKLGEELDFSFYLPGGVEHGALAVFPQYLEHAESHTGFRAGESLAWLDAQTPELFEVIPVDGRATLTYRPAAPGQLHGPLDCRR